MGESNTVGDGWARDHLSLRLSRERKERLAAIAAKMAPGTTPSQSVDRAVELALADIEAFESDSAAANAETTSVEKPVDALSHVATNEILALISARVAAPIQDISRKVEAVFALISAASELSEQVIGDDDANAPGALPLRDWLAHEARNAGRSISKSAVIRATWETKRRVSEGYVSLELDGDMIAIDGSRLDPRLKPITPPRLILDLIDARGPLAGIDKHGAICLWCEPAGSSGWRVVVHAFAPNGGIGKALGELRA